MSTTPPAPQTLYRVQYKNSFTHYSNDQGFLAQGRYHMDYTHWFKPLKVRNHLDWKDRSLEPTPFISLFDDHDAERRALFHHKRGNRDVFIAEVDLSEFTPYDVRIHFGDGDIDISGLIHPKAYVMVFPMVEIKRKFHIEPEIVQKSEWLAVSAIPPELISHITFYR